MEVTARVSSVSISVSLIWSSRMRPSDVRRAVTDCFAASQPASHPQGAFLLDQAGVLKFQFFHEPSG